MGESRASAVEMAATGASDEQAGRRQASLTLAFSTRVAPANARSGVVV